MDVSLEDTIMEGKEFSMTAGQSDGSDFLFRYYRFKDLLSRIASCIPSEGGGGIKLLSCIVILGGTGIAKTTLVSTWVLSTKPDENEELER